MSSLSFAMSASNEAEQSKLIYHAARQSLRNGVLCCRDYFKAMMIKAIKVSNAYQTGLRH